jgi:hypothetical protein
MIIHASEVALKEALDIAGDLPDGDRVIGLMVEPHVFAVCYADYADGALWPRVYLRICGEPVRFSEIGEFDPVAIYERCRQSARASAPRHVSPSRRRQLVRLLAAARERRW